MRIIAAIAAAAGVAAVTAVLAISTVASAASPPTQHHVARPVTTGGYVVSGWSVSTASGTITCSPADASPAAVDANISYCSPSAAYAIACFHGHDGVHALCLTDVVHHKLVRYHVAGAFPHAGKVTHPIPFHLTLGDGTACNIRDGGSGSGLEGHPNWYAVYYCTHNLAVWAPVGGAIIDKSTATWTLHVAPSDGHGTLATKRVAGATFVGTAA